MGDQMYAYRTSQYATSYDGGDSEGRHRIPYDCPPIDESYVVETRVTERLRPGSQPYHHDRRRPQEVDEFLTGVQLEASRPSPKPYSARPGPIGEYRKGNGYGGGYSSDEHDSDSGSGSDDDDDHRRRRHHGRPIGGGGKLGMPTSNINEAVEYLKLSGGGSSRPYGGSETALHGHGTYTSEGPARQYATKYQTTEAVKVKPYGTNTTTTTGHTYGTISNSPTKPYGGPVNNAGDSRPLYYKYPAGYNASETVKHHGGGGGGYGRPINSGGDGRYRDTTGNSHGGNYGATTTASSQVIDCYEAAKRFNGKVIRT